MFGAMVCAMFWIGVGTVTKKVIIPVCKAVEEAIKETNRENKEEKK